MTRRARQRNEVELRTRVFAGKRSPFNSIDDIVAEGKKRTLTVGTSRMAHPASVGILALGEHTGAKFNLIPLSGGKKHRCRRCHR